MIPSTVVEDDVSPRWKGWFPATMLLAAWLTQQKQMAKFVGLIESGYALLQRTMPLAYELFSVICTMNF